VLVTFAASLIFEDMILLIWGTQSYPLHQPLAAAGNFEVGSLVLSGYDMGLIALALAAHWALKYTRYGRLLTVVIFDRETAAAFGINVTVVFTVTFIIGAMLGALDEVYEAAVGLNVRPSKGCAQAKISSNSQT